MDVDELEQLAEADRQGLKGMTVESPPMRSILNMLGRQATQEAMSALAPNLANEARQYNAGRAAAAADVLAMVRDAIPKGE